MVRTRRGSCNDGHACLPAAIAQAQRPGYHGTQCDDHCAAPVLRRIGEAGDAYPGVTRLCVLEDETPRAGRCLAPEEAAVVMP